MKKNNASLKDYLYDSMDYLIVLVIVLFVVSMISWRLDILFNSANTLDNVQFVEKEEEKVLEEIDLEEKSKPIDLAKKEKNNENDLEKTTRNKPIDKVKNETNIKTQETKIETDETIKVNIPQGADSGTIANILASNGLISDTNTFLEQCESMGLATKLKAGDFNIPKDSSLENVITEITK